MKKIFINAAMVLLLPVAMKAQSGNKLPSSIYTSGSENVKKFDNSSRLFRDWSVSVGGGTAFMAFSDITSFYNKKVDFGWNAYASIDKQITHAFGVSLQYQMGQTNQKAHLENQTPDSGVAKGWTKYHQVSLLGDVNLSNLMRRVDNHSKFDWSLHAYGGFGFMGYDTHLEDATSLAPNGAYPGHKTSPLEITQKLGLASFFWQGGLGLKYNATKMVDVELRTMYIVSGDDSFDGGGWNSTTAYNNIRGSRSDNMWTVNLGLTFKLGKHNTHLAWFDPLNDIYSKTAAVAALNKSYTVCKKGDQDGDGVCDDWDRQLDTPKGARVDGAGVALDLDLDGVIDLNDKCVTVYGPIENQGCPTGPAPKDAEVTTGTISTVNKELESIQFALGSDVIKTASYDRLNRVADILKGLDANSKFLVIGATDTRGKKDANLKLSQKRAQAVVNYLTNHGVTSGMLTPEGRGQEDLKFPECSPASKCPEWKNEANRRVYLQVK